MLHTFLLLKVGKFSFLFGSLATSFGWLMYFISRVLRSHWLRLYSLAPLKNLYSVYFQQAHVGFRINLSYFLICILVDDVSNVPFWSRPRYLSDEHSLEFRKPLFDLDKQTSLYSPKMIDFFSKSSPVYPHPRNNTKKVYILP